ncbi:MAG: hypothetical protein J2P49_07525 [Methylocapsa sp.]|nr:hypothetical protein [Methylocapsa sp.]
MSGSGSRSRITAVARWRLSGWNSTLDRWTAFHGKNLGALSSMAACLGALSAELLRRGDDGAREGFLLAAAPLVPGT